MLRQVDFSGNISDLIVMLYYFSETRKLVFYIFIYIYIYIYIYLYILSLMSLTPYSEECVKETKHYITSIIVGKDIVPRLS